MHSSSAADGGHSSTQPKNRNTDEHYDNIARIVDQSITNANRILDTLGTKKENINKKARGKRGPVPESKCSLASTSSAVGSQSTFSGPSTRGFQSYVDTPSRLRSYSKSKKSENNDMVPQCSCKRGREECTCREIELRYADALAKWASSSRTVTPNRGNVSSRSRNNTTSHISMSSVYRSSAGSSAEFSEPSNSSRYITLKKPRRRKLPYRREKPRHTHTDKKASQTHVSNKEEEGKVIEEQKHLTSDNAKCRTCITITHANNVYIKCRCGHTCHQQKGASIKFSLGKEAKHPLVVPSSPKKPAAKEKKKTSFGTDSEKKTETSLHTARCYSKRVATSPKKKFKIVNPEILSSPATDPRLHTPRVSTSEKLRRDFCRRTFESEMNHEKPPSTTKQPAVPAKPRSSRSRTPRGYRRDSRSESSRREPDLHTARCRTPKKSGRGRSEHVRKGRTPRGYKGKSEDSSIRTARAQTPKQKSDGLKFDATFRVNDQETNELHTLIIKADIQGKKIKKLIMNGKTCKV
ncbi:hypothetical protein RB195_004797 [Necator americanus]|uniref:Phlebovirus glycoprotein G2 fusion domain-containing protein n=1 Tax=Necator americanus TaxID=51031 RepID=A0ABR1BNK7_NECAM